MEHLQQTVDTLIKFLYDLKTLNEKLQTLKNLQNTNFAVYVKQSGDTPNTLIPFVEAKHIFMYGLELTINDTKNLIEELVKTRIQEVKNENSTGSQDQPN